MGVPVKKSEMEPPALHQPTGAVAYSAGHSSSLEKSKKRKR
jgi:hypothetical protein